MNYSDYFKYFAGVCLVVTVTLLVQSATVNHISGGQYRYREEHRESRYEAHFGNYHIQGVYPKIMEGCPPQWSLEVSLHGDDAQRAELVQICRYKDSSDWKCADGWKAHQNQQKCIPKNGVEPGSNPSTNLTKNSSPNQFEVKQPKHAHISDEHQFLFINIPFTDQRNIETSYLFDDRRKEGRRVGGHHKIKAFDDAFFNRYHKFAVIRHPCSRLVATWIYFSQGLGNEMDKQWVRNNMNEKAMSSFEDFVEHVLYPGGPIHIENDNHLQTQVGMIFNDDGKFGLNQLLVYEKWNESVAQLGRRLNIDTSSLKKTPAEQSNCNKMYSPVTWEKMIQIYSIDLCVLGYSSETEDLTNNGLNLAAGTLTRRFNDCSSKIKQPIPHPAQDSYDCVMHTYFQPSRDTPPYKQSEHTRTIDTWKEAWEAVGWKTRVLTEKDAEGHLQYLELRKKYEALPTINSKDYEVACYMRHVAMAAVGGGWMSDYDVLPFYMPRCLKPLNDGNFTGYQRHVPALVSGSSTEFTRIANLMANVDYKADARRYSHGDKFHVSDMAVLEALSKVSAYAVLDVMVSPNVLFDGTPVCSTKVRRALIPEGFPRSPWAIHYSHSSLNKLRQKANISSLWPGSSWNADKFNRKSPHIRSEFMADSSRYIRNKCNSTNVIRP